MAIRVRLGRKGCALRVGAGVDEGHGREAHRRGGVLGLQEQAPTLEEVVHDLALTALVLLDALHGLDEEIVEGALLGLGLLLGLLGLGDHLDGLRHQLEGWRQGLAGLLVQRVHAHPEEHVLVLRGKYFDLRVECHLIPTLVNQRLDLNRFCLHERHRFQSFTVVHQRCVQCQAPERKATR